MARTVDEIKREMTDAFMADPVIREKYQLKEEDTFRSAFSLVSLENILFFIVAAAHHVVERIFDGHRDDVERTLERAIVATVPWYYHKALAYQHGDKLTLDEATMQYRYAKIDEGRRVVKYAAVRDRGGSIQILVSGEKSGRPEALSKEVLTAFEAYIRTLKPAGVVISVRTAPADHIRIAATIYADPMILSPQGVRYRDGARPVEDAINAYLGGITFGGTFNKTKLVDAIQAVEGVTDVILGDCSARPDSGTYKSIDGNNYTAFSGSIISDDLNSTLRYVV